MGGKGNSLSEAGVAQVPCPLGTQAPPAFGKVPLGKVALSVPKASASSVEHQVGRPKGQVCRTEGLVVGGGRTGSHKFRLGATGFLLHLLIEVDALGAEHSAVG